MDVQKGAVGSFKYSRWCSRHCLEGRSVLVASGMRRAAFEVLSSQRLGDHCACSIAVVCHVVPCFVILKNRCAVQSAGPWGFYCCLT